MPGMSTARATGRACHGTRSKPWKWMTNQPRGAEHRTGNTENTGYCQTSLAQIRIVKTYRLIELIPVPSLQSPFGTHPSVETKKTSEMSDEEQEGYLCSH